MRARSQLNTNTNNNSYITCIICRNLIYIKMFKKWHVSFHLATHPAILQSRLYKNKIFCIFLNHD